jgi:TolB protein
MRTLLFCILIYLSLISQAYAILTIDITGGKEEGEQPIAIVPFSSSVPSVPENISNIVSNDLYRSGRFKLMPQQSLPEKPAKSSQINYSRWQAAGIPHIVVGSIAANGSGYTVKFELIDVPKRQQILGFSYAANDSNLRQVAHLISDKIYYALTGDRSVFSTLIIYITFKNNEYRLYITDADGANPRLMFTSPDPVFSPSWSPNGQRIAYVAYKDTGRNKRMAINIQEVSSGRITTVSSKQGLNSSPAWSPDGRRLALTLSKDGNPEIYILDLQTRNLTRFTKNSAIDTEAEWSKDGKSIAFTSDRGGQPQIYLKPVNGGKAKRLTYQGTYNTRPRFSPVDANKLVMLHNNGKGFQIALLNLKTKKLKILTKTTLDESPTFSPNGNMILYTTGSALSAVSINGRANQHLAKALGKQVREPAWSPFLNRLK